MKKTVIELLSYGREQLSLAEFPERESELTRIFLDCLNVLPHELSFYREKVLEEDQIIKIVDFIEQRRHGRPLAYILGYTYFFRDRFPVSEETLIPRYDTENLVEAVRKSYHKDQVFKILDIGTGTGVIALSLSRLFANAVIKGIDIVDAPFKNSLKALKITSPKISIEKLDFLDRSSWESLGDWDCIVSNPPYLDDKDMDVLDNHVKQFEPHTALYAGKDGMAFYNAIAEFSDTHLRDKGMIFLEIDHKYSQVESVFQSKKYKNTLINDLNDLPRVLVLRHGSF